MGTRFFHVILNTELVCEQCENGPVLGFGLCGPCYNSGRRCFNQDHNLTLVISYDEGSEEASCSRFQQPRGVICDVNECKKKIEGLYFRQY